MVDYKKGKTPDSIQQHEKVASAYGNPTLNLSLEVTDRIQAGEFTWNEDFKNLHPSPFGHRLYANSIARMFNTAFQKPLSSAVKPHALPDIVDRKSYVNGRLGSISSVHHLKGFKWNPAWEPIDKKGTRSGFVHVPALFLHNREPVLNLISMALGWGCSLPQVPMPGALNSTSTTPDFVHWRHSHAGVEVSTSPGL